MPINERGEYVRENEAPDISSDTEHEKLMNEARELAERQDQEPETADQISARKKDEMRKRLMGE